LSHTRPRIVVPDLARVSTAALRRMVEAGKVVLACQDVLAKSGDNVVNELLRDQGTFFEWEHYPKDDVFDRETQAQYYYHAHPPGERSFPEHGHFHTFLRPKGMPADTRPLRLPNYKPPKDRNDALSHLVAISMDTGGRPVRLFTTNRWVTGETWYAAPDVIAMLDRFAVGHAQPSWPVNRWITALLRLFRPQIVALLGERDIAIAAWKAKHPRRNTYEDRDLEVTSIVPISPEGQIAAARRALRKRS
jgi:hypothetical protein